MYKEKQKKQIGKESAHDYVNTKESDILNNSTRRFVSGSKPSVNARRAAYETLLGIEQNAKFSNIAVSETIVKYSISGRERDLYTKLVYGTVEKAITLDYIIQQYISKRLKTLDKSVLIILRLSVYQIMFCEKIPESAAVDEGVKLAKRYASRATGFINAVLRRVCAKDILMPHKDDFVKFLSVLYSVDESICRLFVEQYGNEKAENILKGFDNIPRICLNVNISRGQKRDEFIESSGYDMSLCRYSTTGVILNSGMSLSDSECIADGSAFVQGEASQLAVSALEPRPDMSVIDVCASPGGKSFAAANIMRSKGHILSLDVHSNKLSLISEGAERLGYNIISVAQHDGRFPISELSGTADRVICDVPCSGFGVMAKKPELRYKKAESADGLPDIQYEILKSSSSYLKRGGIMVYSTCTINRKENENVVKRFIHENSGYSLMDFSFKDTQGPDLLNSSEGMLTLLPENGTDGFFIARIVKN